jgi:hypothetical protein
MALHRAAALVTAIAIAGAGSAFAAALSFDGRSLGMDAETTPRCTTAGVGVIQNVSGSTVISVTVSNLPAGCGNATLQVAVNNQASSSSGSSTVPVGGGSVTVTLAVAVAIAASEEIDLVFTGP